MSVLVERSGLGLWGTEEATMLMAYGRPRSGIVPWVLVLLSFFAVSVCEAATRRALLICGHPGDAEHQAMYANTVASLTDSLTARFGFERENIRVQFAQVTAAEAAIAEVHGGATRKELEAEATALCKLCSADDAVWVVVLGHANHDGRESFLNLPGPDLRLSAFADLFEDLGCREQVFLLTCPVSGYAVKPLARQGRLVISATEADLEVNETLFHHSLAKVLSEIDTGESYDFDKDGRLSWFDAYVAITRDVAQQYLDEELIATEHAMLEDNGDGRGREVQLDYLPEQLGGRAGTKWARPGIRPGRDGELAAGLLLPDVSDTESEETNVADKVTQEEGNDTPPADSTTVHGTVVDTRGIPVGGAKVWIKRFGLATEGRSSADGEFSITVSGGKPAGSLVIASNENGLLGAKQISSGTTVLGKQLVELKPARRVDVSVINGDGQSVSDAAVHVQSAYVTVATGKTNAAGRLSLPVPPDLQLQYVFADAGKRGVSYVIFRAPTSPRDDPFSLPHDHRESITLTLDETRSITVKAVDQDDNPIAGALVTPWMFSLPKRGGRANLGSFMQKQTDANGLVSYNNIPAANEHDVTIWVRKEGYEPEGRFTFDPKSEQQQLTARLSALLPVKGRVVHQDGRPAAGINVMAAGDGHGFDAGFRSEATTAADGTFELKVAPNRYYAFVARDKRYGSPLVTRVVFDQPVSGIELNLQESIRVFGRLTTRNTGEVVPGGYVQLYQRPGGHGYYDLPTDQRLPNPTDSRTAVTPMIVVSGKTDDEGRFEYFVGPGTFYAFGPRDAQQDTFELVNQREFEIHLQAKPKLEGKLIGRVVMKDDPDHGVAGAQVFGKYIPPLAVTDDEGKFESQLLDSDVLCGAFTDDLQQGALKTVPAGAQRVRFEMAPTAVVRGRLVHKDTGLPASNEQIQAAIRIMDENGSTWSNRFQRSDTTREDGAFELKGIVPGRRYDFDVVRDWTSHGTPRRSSPVGEFTASTAGVVDVGVLALPAPYRPPTTNDRIARAFQGQDDLERRLAQRLADAELAYQQVLLVVADPEADSTKQFFGAWYDTASMNLPFRRALANYIVICVEIDRSQFREQQGVAEPSSGGMTFAILNPDGRLVVETQFAQLSADGKLNRGRLTEFLATRRVPLPDARRVLTAARTAAKRDGRRVLVQVSGPGCAPCVLLSRYLDRQSALISKDYVYVKIDSRMTHGEEVINEIRAGDDHGIPWMVITTADGKRLVTSDSDEGNIGFPSTAAGRTHFEQMLRLTAANLSDDDIQNLIDGLSRSE